MVQGSWFRVHGSGEPCAMSHVPCAMCHARGFTLMEMMVVLVIFTIVIGMAFTALRLNEISRENVSVQIELYRKNMLVHNALSTELSLSSPNRLNTNTTDDSCSSNTPCFQIPVATNDNYDIIWGAGATGTENYWIHYYLNGTNVERVVLTPAPAFSPGPPRIIGDSIVAFSYPYIDTAPNSIVITSTAQRTAVIEGHTRELTSESQVYLRND
jgi:prepilin-type N-terminal cleavage/methylation domain-containing protein